MAVNVLYLVRHAQPGPGEDSADPALSDVGIRQATALGERLRRVRVTELHHGPSSRTTETARQLAAVPETERDVDGVAIDAAIERFAVMEAGDRHVVLVTHSFVIGWFVRRVLRMPWAGWAGLQPLPAALTVIAVRDTAPLALAAYNDGGHLTGSLRTGDALQLGL